MTKKGNSIKYIK